MPPLTIVAHINAKPETLDLVKTELLQLIDPTRAEDGCLQYDLHQDESEPTHFVFFENWESRASFEAHMASKHLADFLAATEGAVESLAINQLTKLA